MPRLIDYVKLHCHLKPSIWLRSSEHKQKLSQVGCERCNGDGGLCDNVVILCICANLSRVGTDEFICLCKGLNTQIECLI